MTTATTFPAFVNALKANLETHFAATSGLEAVKAFTAPVNPGKIPDRMVVITGTATPEITPEQMPKTRADLYDVIGTVRADKTGRSTLDGGETAAVTAREDCKAVLDAIATVLDADHAQSGTVTSAYLAETNWDQGIDPTSKKRACAVEFKIRVRARVGGT